MGLRTIISSVNPLQQSHSGVTAGKGVLNGKATESMEAELFHPPITRFSQGHFEAVGLKATGRVFIGERTLCSFAGLE